MLRPSMQRIWAALVLLAATTFSSKGSGYGYESPISSACHETLTLDAMRAARKQWPSAAALEPTSDDLLVMDDLVFSVPPDLRDIGIVTMLFGVRDHDLKGESGIEVQELAAVHGADHGQAEHCLRRTGHDEPTGTAEAVAECRDFIRRLAFAAIDQGLDDQGRVDGSKRTRLDVYLAFRHSVRISLPTFYVRLGQALHTLQDAFSHTFRTPDHRRITVALNWVDQVEGRYEEYRDGPGHMRELDLCFDLDAFRQARLKTAREATDALLAAVFDHGTDRAAKKQAVDAVLADYMSYEPGCTFDNNWCAAPENAYADGACTCRVPGTHGSDGAPSWPAMLTALALAGCIARRRS